MANGNPTKTGRIERAWLADVGRRFATFEKNIMGLFATFVNNLDSRILKQDRNEPLDLDAAQIKQMMIFVRQQIDKVILGVVVRDGVEIQITDEWQRQYIERSYRKALAVSTAQLEAANLTGDAVGFLGSGTATPVLSSGIASLAPVHLESISFLHSRAFNSLDNVTQEMANKMRGILTNGVEQGASVFDTANQLSERIGITKNRARLIARTETIQAYQKGVINNAEYYSEFTDQEVMLLWTARLDSRVREQHAKWHGVVGTPELMNKRINISPYNCRCSLSIATEANLSPEELVLMKKARKAQLALFDKKSKKT